MKQKPTTINKQIEKKLIHAFQEGSKIKYKTLLNYLYCICEFYAELFKPEGVSTKDFLKNTLETLLEEYKLKYESQKQTDEK